MPDNEMEERVLSNKPTLGIENITAIHVPVQDTDKNSLQLLKRLAIKLRIPIYFYDTTIITTTHPSKRIKVPIFPVEDTRLDDDILSIKLAKTVSVLAVSPPDKRLYSTDTVQQLLQYLQDRSFVKHLFDTNQFSEYLVPAIRKMRVAGFDSQDLVNYLFVKAQLANNNSSILDLHYLLSKTRYSREDKQFTNLSPYTLELEHRAITEYNVPVPEANEMLAQYGTFDNAILALRKRMKVR